MKSIWFKIVVVLLVFLGACSVPEPTAEALDTKGFSVDEAFITTYTPDHTLLSKIENKTYQRVILLANTFYNYFEALNYTNSVVGVFNKSRMANAPEMAVSVGEGANFDIEKIISLNPDLIICNSYQLDQLKSITSAKLVYDEYLESDPLKRIQLLRMLTPITGYSVNVDSVIAEKQVGINGNYYPINKEILKLDNFGGDWFQPGCETYISRVVALAGAKMVCVKGSEKSEKVSNEKAILKLANHELLLFLDWGPSKEGWRQRIGRALELDVHPKKILYCNTQSSGYFQESVLDTGEIINDLHQVLKTEEPGSFFEIIELEK